MYHYDHLGSIDVVTRFGSSDGTYARDAGGKPSRFSEDAWGQRRNPDTWSGPPTTTDDGGHDSVTPRGYTGHEMLDDLGLVHMNGRIYDPLLGRMLSADIVVQDAFSLQHYNRYSYVQNNPLTHTDPTGFFTGTYPGFRNDVAGANMVLENKRVQGALKITQAAGEATAAGTLAVAPTGVSQAGAVVLGAHAMDIGMAGLKQLITGQETQTMASQLAENGARAAGASEQTAQLVGQAPDAIAGVAAIGVGINGLLNQVSAESRLVSAAPKTGATPEIKPTQSPATEVKAGGAQNTSAAAAAENPRTLKDPLPRDKGGQTIVPEPAAEGRPHTVVGTRTDPKQSPEPYRQGV